MVAADWDAAAAGLPTGAAAMRAYLALLESQNIDANT